MSIEKHVYQILVAQGPCLFPDLEQATGIRLQTLLSVITTLMDQGVIDWMEGPDKSLGDVYLGVVG